MARSIPGATRVDVDLQTVRFTIPGEGRRIYLTPPAASGYVIAYDAGDDIHPFVFRLSERHQVRPRNDKKTPAARARERATGNLKNAEVSQARAEAKRLELGDDADPVAAGLADRVLKEAKSKVTKRKRERRAVEREVAGLPQIEPDLTPDPATGQRAAKPPARAFKYGTRAYGHRDLRINQDEPTPENTAARRAVMGVYDEWSQDEADLEN